MTPFDDLAQPRMRQCSFIGSGWNMIALDHLRALVSLVLQLEGRLEKVGMQPRCSIQTFKRARRFDTIEATVSRESPDDGAVLLLDESLIILLVDARACHLEVLRAAPRHDDIVHEGAVGVEIGAANDPGKQALCALHHPQDEVALARHQRHALGPTSRDVDHRQRWDERGSHRCAAMGKKPGDSNCYWMKIRWQVTQNPGGGSCQSLNVRIGTSRRTAE